MATSPQTPPAVPPGAPGRTRGQLAAEIADGLVQLWRERSGTGPRRARAHVTDAHVTALFEGTLTPAERTLVARGRAGLVRAQREELRASMEAEATALVERVTGHPVVAALGDALVEPDHATQVFVLGPPLPDPRPDASTLASVREAIPEPLQVEVRDEDGVMHIRPVGELDLGSTGLLRAPLQAIQATGAAVVLELDGLTFVDSAGVGVIVQAWETARRVSQPFRCTPGRPAVQRTLQVAGLDRLLTPED
jgi:anti-anti-sigma factor